MSTASAIFEQSIQDAENLLHHFNALNTKPPPPEIEVLKRAGLIMAMTAWETYVEDRVIEGAEQRLAELPVPSITEFVRAKLGEEIRRLHNPNAEKTIRLFEDYVGVDPSRCWAWNHYEPQLVRDRLNQYLKLRGEVVHRSRVIDRGSAQAHPVTKDELRQAIQFLKELVKATEKSMLIEAPKTPAPTA